VQFPLDFYYNFIDKYIDRSDFELLEMDTHTHTQTSFIEISIEAGILRSGKGAIHASVGLLSAVVFLAQNWYGISVSSLRMQLSQWLVTAVVS
jgi:hypothetical protein